jgi:hypothetical protein
MSGDQIDSYAEALIGVVIQLAVGQCGVHPGNGIARRQDLAPGPRPRGRARRVPRRVDMNTREDPVLINRGVDLEAP